MTCRPRWKGFSRKDRTGK